MGRVVSKTVSQAFRKQIRLFYRTKQEPYGMVVSYISVAHELIEPVTIHVEISIDMLDIIMVFESID